MSALPEKSEKEEKSFLTLNVVFCTQPQTRRDITTARGNVETALGGSGTTYEQAIALKDVLKVSETSITTAISALNTLLGGSGTSYERAQTVVGTVVTLNTLVTSERDALQVGQADITTARGNIDMALGGSGTTYDRVQTLVTLLLTSPTNVISADLTTLMSFLGFSGSTFQARLNALAQVLNSLDASSGSTLQARLSAIQTSVGTGADLITAITSERDALQVGQTDITTARGNIDMALGGAGTTYVRTTSARDALKASETSIVTATTALNTLLGGSGTSYVKAQSIAEILDGVQNLSGITSFIITTPASSSGNTVTLVGNDGNSNQSYSINNIGDGSGGTTSVSNGGAITLTSGGGNAITFVNNSGSSITSAVVLAAYLATAYPASTVIKANLYTKAVSLRSRILTNSTGNTSGDVATAQNLITTNYAPTLQGALDVIAAFVDGTDTTSDTLEDKLITVRGYMDGSAVNIQAALDIISTLLVSNKSFSQPLSTLLSSQSSALDGSIASLPDDATFGFIGTAASSDGAGGVDIQISSGFGYAQGTYNLSSGALGNIRNNDQFTLTYGEYFLFLYNRSGSTINTQARAISYLQSMYPAGSKLATGLSDKIGNLMFQLGGTATTVQARIANITSIILATPTGVLSTDLAALRSFLVASLGANFESDINTLAQLLTATNASSGFTLYASITNLHAMLGGFGSTSARIQAIAASLDGVQSLSGLTSFTVTQVASSSGDTVSITGDDGNGVNTYSIGNIGDGSSGTTTVTNGGTVTLVSGSNTITFVNNSGSSITSAAFLAGYLANAYPISSIIKATLVQKITAIQAKILTTSTGNMSGDVTTVQNLIDPNSTDTIEGRLNTVAASIDETSTSSFSSLKSKIGDPTINGMSTNVLAVIGGSAVSVAEGLGDPMIGITGLASLIRNNGAPLGVVSGFMDCSSFDNAISIRGQLEAFLSIISTVGTDIKIPTGSYTNLRELLAACTPVT